MEMDKIACAIVRKYVEEHLDKTDPEAHFDTYIVWKAKILQNWKYLISTSLLDGMYYELTYNGDKREWYLDAYKKFENRVIAQGLARETRPVRVLKWDEILWGVGCGWIEIYIDGDPVNDVDPYIDVTQCVWAYGCVVVDGWPYMPSYLDERYGKEHGCRVWTEKPTEAERENTPWGDKTAGDSDTFRE